MKLFKRNNGFTLVELLIAMAILSIALPSFFTFLNTQIFRTKLNLDMANALFLAEKRLETLLHKNYDDLDLSDTISTNNYNLNPSIDYNSLLNNESTYMSSNFDHFDNPVILNNTKFYILWNVAEDTSLSSISKFKKVGIIVCWIFQGQGHKVFLLTLKREE